MKSFIVHLITIFAIFTVTCTDKPPGFKGTLSGQLLDSCNGNPLSNIALKLVDAGSDRNFLIDGVDQHEVAQAVTNSNGEFTFEFSNPFSAGQALIYQESNALAYGEFGIDETNQTANIGQIYFQPLKKKVKLKIHQTKGWYNGDYVVIRKFLRGFAFKDDTLNQDNTTISGKNMYATLDLYFATKLYSSTADTSAMAGRTGIKWRTAKNDDFDNHSFETLECDTSLGYIEVFK
ncbi:hypothetical protein GYB22_08810 [bacterium]|nr:hypothetical protein [bacterium]